MKQGEAEARTILERFGYTFDNAYCDDNSCDNMPDFRFADGRYLEVTHTAHSMNPCSIPSDKVSLGLEAYQRLCQSHGRSSKKLDADRKLVKKMFGITVGNNLASIRNTKFPMCEFSSNTILETVKRKSVIHESHAPIDLFVFITEDEWESLKSLLKIGWANGSKPNFVNELLDTSFGVIFFCVYDYDTLSYDLENPFVMRFDLRFSNVLCDVLHC